MGCGIVQPRAGREVPGTVTILKRSREHNPTGDRCEHATHRAVKYDAAGRFVLVPQPSDDPNDPLNWPRWKRDLILTALCLMAVVATVLSPILAATSFSLLSVFSGVGFTNIALLTGYHLMGVGVAGAFFVPSARVWGKRHLYLLGTLIVCATSVWGGVAGRQANYTSFLWARIFQGVGLAPFEALVSATVGDLFFVHERGKRMALATVATFAAAFFAPVIVGKIASTQGFEWTFFWVAIISGALFPVIFFCVPETAYVRANDLNLDYSDNDMHETGLASDETSEKPSSEGNTPLNSSPELSKTPGARSTLYTMNTGPKPQKRSYLQSLAPFNGRKSTESYWKLFLRPFPLFLHPGVLWACLTQGVLIGWTVLIGIVLSAIFILPPLNFTPLQTGYLFTAAFIGALAGFLLCGALADPIANALTRRNGGVFEPEFRIPLVLFQVLFAGIGLYGFGWTAADHYTYGWVSPDIFFGFVLAGMVCGAVASAMYIVDAHREIAIEAFTAMMIFKNIFSFAITFRGYDWLVEVGPRPIFTAIGSVQVGIGVLAVFMYVFGKVNRAFWARHDILALFRLR